MARFPAQGTAVTQSNGTVRILAGASVLVQDKNGDNATLYTAATGSEATDNPMTADANGNYSAWVATDSGYVVTITSGDTSASYFLEPGALSGDGVVNLESTEFYRRDDGSPDLVEFMRWRGRAFFGDSSSFAGYAATSVDESGVTRNYRTGGFLNASSETTDEGYPYGDTSGATIHLDEGTNLFPVTDEKTFLVSQLGDDGTETQIELGDASILDASGIVRIGFELIYYAQRDDTTLYGVVRGFNPKGQTTGVEINETIVMDPNLATPHVGSTSSFIGSIAEDIDEFATTVLLDDVTGLVGSGVLRIGEEIVNYTISSGNELSIVRSVGAVSHKSGDSCVTGETVFQVYPGTRLRGYETNATVISTADRGGMALVGASQGSGGLPPIGVTGIGRAAFSGTTNVWAGYFEASRSDVATQAGVFGIEVGIHETRESPETQRVNPYNDGYGGHSKGIMVNAGIDETNTTRMDVMYHGRGLYTKDAKDPEYDGTILGSTSMAFIVAPESGMHPTSSDGVSPQTKKAFMLGEFAAITGSESTADEADPQIRQEFFMGDNYSWIINRTSPDTSTPELLAFNVSGGKKASVIARQEGGVSLNSADIPVTLPSFDALAAYWAARSSFHRDGDRIEIPGAVFEVHSGASDLPGLSGLRPYGETIDLPHFNVAGADDSGELDDFLSFFVSASKVNVYVSPGGTGSGKTVGDPTDLDSAMKYVRAAMLTTRNRTFQINLSAGVHTPQIRQNFWNNDRQYWVFGTNILAIVGEDVAGLTPTSIIDDSGLNDNWLHQDHHFAQAVRLYFKDVKFTNFDTGKPVKVRYGGGAVWMENCHCDGTQGLLEARGMFVRVFGSAAANPTLIQNHTEAALVLQNGQVRVGDAVNLPGTGVINFDGVGGAMSVTRFCQGYVRNCTLTNGKFLWFGENYARIRTQGNTGVSWSEFFINIDATCEWDNDNSNFPDIFTGASKYYPVLHVRAKSGGPLNNEATGSGRETPHRQYQGAEDSIGPMYAGAVTSVVSGDPYEIATVSSADWSSVGGPTSASVGGTFTATSSADVSALGTVYKLKLDLSEVVDGGSEDFGPVRAPGWFLFSPTAQVRILWEFEVITNKPMKLFTRLGNQMLSQTNFDSSSGNLHRWDAEVIIRGTTTAKSHGYYRSNAMNFNDGPSRSHQDDTDSFETSVVREATGDIKDWKFELEFEQASDYVKLQGMQSYLMP